MKRSKANWIGNILRGNYLLNHIIEGTIEGGIEVAGRWGKRSEQLQNELKQMTGCWKLKDHATDRTLWRTRFGRGYGPVVKLTIEWLNERKMNMTPCSLVDDSLECNTPSSGRLWFVLWPRTRLQAITLYIFTSVKIWIITVYASWYQPLDKSLIVLPHLQSRFMHFSVFYGLCL